MEVRINKEVRNYQESLFFGLSLRQFLFALLAVLVALAVYFCLHPVLGTGEIGWVCILAAFPFALGGFFTYNGMTLERFLMAYIRSEFFMPKRLLFRSNDLYVQLMEHSSIKEAIRLDSDPSKHIEAGQGAPYGAKVRSGHHPHPPDLAGWAFSVWREIFKNRPLF